MDFSTILGLTGGLAWTLAYIEAIRLGFIQKTFAIPFWALALNFSWEFMQSAYSVRYNSFSPQSYINIVWLLFDILILITYFLYGKKSFKNYVNPAYFMPYSMIVLLISMFIEFAFVKEFGGTDGAIYSAFLQNVLMSVLFILMLIERKSKRGQSLLLAISKGIGTAANTVLFGVIGHADLTNLVLVLGAICFFLDVIYSYMLFKIKTPKFQST
ncbi:transmembrane-type terpene cyclase [Parapedobacter indicus]|uniref:PQ loop repeat-containing protein n=1 Tax=Parapedobacter indicus TaxID=1477437 RepID=A0A1I3QWG7_9SPHI|nr:hypothetical protein [Parapedobacter indicus]PPL00272.1 hypothetical protein CLV26_109150 [Parapedobacter indicus]SFJ38418.1 hypothetical protein SAMN05444682_109150 [Parapedobacter indicus]